MTEKIYRGEEVSIQGLILQSVSRSFSLTDGQIRELKQFSFLEQARRSLTAAVVRYPELEEGMAQVDELLGMTREVIERDAVLRAAVDEYVRSFYETVEG